MKITVYLNDRMTEALMLSCGKERRYPRQQAEYLLEQVLCGPVTRPPEDAYDARSTRPMPDAEPNHATASAS